MDTPARGLPARVVTPLPALHLQAKETGSKQKEFEEMAKKVRVAIEQLATLQ